MQVLMNSAAVPATSDLMHGSNNGDQIDKAAGYAVRIRRQWYTDQCAVAPLADRPSPGRCRYLGGAKERAIPPEVGAALQILMLEDGGPDAGISAACEVSSGHIP